MIAVYVTVLALFISLALVPLLARWAEPLGLIDRPGPRKIHTAAVPRIGGIAIALGALLSLVVWLPLRAEISGYLAGALVIALAGFADDRLDLDFRAKFAAQIAGALLFVFISDVQLTRVPFSYGGTMPGWVGLPLTVLVVVGITNAVNLSDGMDGLAGGTALIAASVLGYFAYLGGDMQIALVALALIGSTLGFLRYNTFPARVFMGDTGSQFLGFSVAALGILVIEQCNTAIGPFVPVLVLGLPILDTLYVMTRRIRAGRSPFSPDRQHLHHRLLDGGLSQYEALLAIYGLQAVLVALAWLLRYAPDALVLLAFVAFSGVLLGSMNWWRHQHTEGRVLVGRLDLVERLVDFIKAKNALKRLGHHVVVFGLALLFPLVALSASRVGQDIGWLALLLVAALAFTLRPVRLMHGSTLWRLAAFVVAALVVYLAEAAGLRAVPSVDWFRGYLVVIALGVGLWLRFGGGTEFRLNALDVLVILIVAIVPNMPLVRELGIGPIVIGTLLLFYASELVVGTQTSGSWLFRVSVFSTLVLLSARGIYFSGV